MLHQELFRTTINTMVACTEHLRLRKGPCSSCNIYMKCPASEYYNNPNSHIATRRQIRSRSVLSNEELISGLEIHPDSNEFTSQLV